MTSLIIKGIAIDAAAKHIAHVKFLDASSGLEFFARLDLISFWFIDPVRFEQDLQTNKQIAQLATTNLNHTDSQYSLIY